MYEMLWVIWKWNRIAEGIVSICSVISVRDKEISRWTQEYVTIRIIVRFYEVLYVRWSCWLVSHGHGMVCLGPQRSANICKVRWGHLELQSRGQSALKIPAAVCLFVFFFCCMFTWEVILKFRAKVYLSPFLSQYHPTLVYALPDISLKGLAIISYFKFHFFHTCWYFCIFRDPLH